MRDDGWIFFGAAPGEEINVRRGSRLSSLEGFAFIVDLDPQGRVAMQRDMELVREILRTVQAKNDVDPREIPHGDHKEWIFKRHMEAMYSAGLFDGTIHRPQSGLPRVLVRDLSWEGHDFAAAIGNDSVWAKIKAKLSPSELAGVPLKVLAKVSAAALQSYLMDKLGLDVKPD